MLEIPPANSSRSTISVLILYSPILRRSQRGASAVIRPSRGVSQSVPSEPVLDE